MGDRARATLAILGTLIVAGCAARGPLVATSPRASAGPSQTPASATATRCTGIELRSSPATSVEAGQPVTFSATARGCSPVDYRFIRLDVAGGDWTVAQDWGPSASWTWSTGDSPPARYSVVADARARNEPGSDPDVSVSMPFELTPPGTPAAGGAVDLTVSGAAAVRITAAQPPPCTVAKPASFQLSLYAGPAAVTITLNAYQGALLYLTNPTDSLVVFTDLAGNWSSRSYGAIIVDVSDSTVIKGRLNVDLDSVAGAGASRARLGPVHVSGDWACTPRS